MKLDVKGWLFRTFVADTLAKRAYAALDDYCTKRWPQGWPRVQFALGGWVTKLGLIMAAVAGAALWAVDRFQEGQDPASAGIIMLYAAAAVAGLGLLRKGLKFLIYYEALDRDGWLDDKDMPKPEGLDDNDRALLAGRLTDIRVDLEHVRNLAASGQQTRALMGHIDSAVGKVSAARKDLRKIS